MEILRCMDKFLITKIPVYILFNPVCKSYSVRMCSTCCSFPISYACAKKCIFNGRRSNQADVRNTKQYIINVYKMYLETLWCNNNTSNTSSLKQVCNSINYTYLVLVVHNSSL